MARLLIDRPAQRNAIDAAVRESLLAAMAEVLADPAVPAVVLGGVGGTFSAGGDLPTMKGLSQEATRERFRHIHLVCRAVAQAPLPVVTAMDGGDELGPARVLTILENIHAATGDSRYRSQPLAEPPGRPGPTA